MSLPSYVMSMMEDLYEECLAICPNEEAAKEMYEEKLENLE